MVRGSRARQPGEMSPFVVACDSLVVMRGPSCKTSVGRSPPWRGFTQQDTLKLPLGNLETGGGTETAPSHALLPWVVPELGVFPGSVSVCRSLRTEAVTGTQELNLGNTRGIRRQLAEKAASLEQCAACRWLPGAGICFRSCPGGLGTGHRAESVDRLGFRSLHGRCSPLASFSTH